jgi:hypothetical protein
MRKTSTFSFTYKGKLSRITSDLSEETLKARKIWNDIFKFLRVNHCQPKLLYPAKLSLKTAEEINSF